MEIDNIPIEKLELFGINAEVLNQLPEEFTKNLLRGDITPMINTRTVTPNGMVVEMPMKFRVTKDDFGKSELMVYPAHKDFKNYWQLTPTAFENLKNGAVLHIDGHYIQREPETNNIIKVSDQQMQLDKKLSDIEKVLDIELGIDQKNQIRNGRPVELEIGGEKCTVGLDLKDKDHFNTLKGGLNDWEHEKKVIYDILHPEYMGVVKTDENRWEYQQIQMNKEYPQTLKEKPMMAKSASMKM